MSNDGVLFLDGFRVWKWLQVKFCAPPCLQTSLSKTYSLVLVHLLKSDWSSRRYKFMSSLLKVSPYRCRMLVSKCRDQWQTERIFALWWCEKCWMSQNFLQLNENKSWFSKLYPHFTKTSWLPADKCQTCSQKPGGNIWQWPFVWKTSYKSRSLMFLLTEEHLKNQVFSLWLGEGHRCFYIISVSLL